MRDHCPILYIWFSVSGLALESSRFPALLGSQELMLGTVHRDPGSIMPRGALSFSGLAIP